VEIAAMQVLQGIEIYTIIGLYFDDNDYGIHKSHSQL
jgi:hypothetical protein